MNQGDRRIQRTKKLIRNTFAELIEEKGLHHVTIKDLTERADINRGTFYLHYLDKYDLLEQSEDELLHGIKMIAQELDNANRENLQNGQEPPPAGEKYFSFLQENGLFVKAILGPKGDPGFQTKMKALIANQIKGRLLSGNPENMPVPQEYLIAYLVSAHLGVVQHWIEGGFKKTPKEMARIISNMNFYGPLAAGGLKD
ncbi:TetR/AcrR family transcriptional regulator [Evansella sp. LMS18]|uniref:TetR/AcrR family transcriptional regulator n=1 Tax=Evansella sp. LMS18 TaxID=2924033 RepID=UPI0020D047B6|nr:TetR/AcrR family transcriptional regulator [Evansella sp. LMS18]UTR10417.1 TetR/AcrR family transcriptional regulator [Evansella sp. LMS18]